MSTKRIGRAGLAAALCVLQCHPASAQWHGSVGLGGRSVIHSEYDMAGRRLVREAGWLPGFALNAAYTAGALTCSAGGDLYRGSIDYRGQSQGGAAVGSTTATTLASVRAGAAYALNRDYSVRAGLELDGWRRDINGTAGNAGLQERYRTRRIIAGAGKAWHPAAGTFGAEAALVFSAPERLRVGFSGMFDPASFQTRPARGIRIGASFRPAFAPYLELGSRYDWTRVPRSGDAPLTRNGQFMGTVAQPEHERQALTLTAALLF